MADNICAVSTLTLDAGVSGLRIENDILEVVVLPDKGADIYVLRHKPSNLDVLYKSPWGVRMNSRAASSSLIWHELYAGGWQVLCPNGGAACEYKGVELGFHGEASVSPWSWSVRTATEDRVEISLATRLIRSPLRLERTMVLDRGSAVLAIRERIVNEGGEPIDYLWGHHPAFGGEFLRGTCRIDTSARRFTADDTYDGPHNPLEPGRQHDWPWAAGRGGKIDLARVPSLKDRRQLLGYLSDFAGGAWFAITNTDLGVGVGLAWSGDVMPFAWLYQEMNASVGFPWFGNTYLMAIEPNTSIPGQGLVAVMRKTGTHRTLQAGGSAEVQLRAVIYEATTPIIHISTDGTVETAGRDLDRHDE